MQKECFEIVRVIPVMIVWTEVNFYETGTQCIHCTITQYVVSVSMTEANFIHDTFLFATVKCCPTLTFYMSLNVACA